MPMQKVTEQDGQSANTIDENIEQMKALFPDAFTEGPDGEQKVNFDVLRQLLGDASVLDEGEEKYGLNWHGKKQARQIALTPSTGTLLPCPEESVDWDTTQNLFIEGDNLEVLKLLQKSYAGEVKMIYIDPPYNTGSEFIYPDKFQENLETYLRYTNQISVEGKKLSSAMEISGRKHTQWLNMIYPRIRVARNLLKADGLIAIHIDENEIANLTGILDEIFGEENNLGSVVWDKRNPKGKVSGVAQQHEYIAFYCRNREAFAKSDYFYRKKNNASKMLTKAADVLSKLGGVNDASRDAFKRWAGDQKNGLSGGEKAYCHIDDSGDVYRPVSMAAPDKPETRSHRPLNHPISGKPCPVPEKGWRFPDASMDKLLKKGEILFGVDEKTQPQRKYLLKENMREAVPSLLYHGGSDDALGLPFDNPKPVDVSAKLIEAVCADGDIVLDFFAGSATSAHACMQVSADEGRNINFVMIQLPEIISAGTAAYKKGFRNIAEISRERIKLARGTFTNTVETIDCGFRAFKLASSNINAWNPDRTDLEETLLSHKDHLVEGRSEQDVLYELLLKRGIELTVPIEEKKVAGKTIFSIGYGVVFACLDTSIAKGDVDAVAGAIAKWHKELEPETDSHVFFRDSAFADDTAKTNMAAILEQNGIAHVRSL